MEAVHFAHPSSIDAYIRQGWSLVPIPPGTKGPHSEGWNKKENALKSSAYLPSGYGIGLAHAYSGTMALDIDNFEVASVELEKRGISLHTLYNSHDAVIIESGKAGHGKLLYKMPFGLILPSRKLSTDRKAYLEFRCGTTNGLTAQDVLPPSIHPETKQPYIWRGNWTNLPTLPVELLTFWQELLTVEQPCYEEVSETPEMPLVEIKKVVSHISPDCSRGEWISVGMALHWYGKSYQLEGESFSLWKSWSEGSKTKYCGDREIVQQWKSFNSSKENIIKLGTLMHIAKENGYIEPEPDLSALFAKAEAENPLKLTADLKPAPPYVDLELFPQILKQRAEEISVSIGCDPIVPLFAGIGAVCAVADAQSRLKLMDGYEVPPILWTMTIGSPADKKTPGSSPMFTLLAELEKEAIPEFKKKLLDWEYLEASHVAAKKSYLAHASNVENLLSDSDVPQVPDLPKQPVDLRLSVSDITSQQLVRVVANRPRGVLCELDEMTSWIKRLCDKTSGEDRGAWLRSYEAKRYTMDRVGAGSIIVDNFAVAVYGNIQPRVFREAINALSGDGLLQRFIPGVLRREMTREPNPIPDYMTNKVQWENALRVIFALPTMTYRLSQSASVVFRDFQRWYEETKKREYLLMASDLFMTSYGKLEGTAGRMMLIFHLLENPFSLEISESIVKRVIEVIKSFVIPSIRYAFDQISNTSTFDNWLIEYMIQHADKPSIEMSEIKRSGHRQMQGMNTWQQDQQIITSMISLEKANWVIRVDDGSKEKVHYAKWAINNQLKVKFAEHRQSVIDAKQAQMNEIYILSSKPVPAVYGNKNPLE